VDGDPQQSSPATVYVTFDEDSPPQAVSDLRNQVHDLSERIERLEGLLAVSSIDVTAVSREAESVHFEASDLDSDARDLVTAVEAERAK